MRSLNLLAVLATASPAFAAPTAPEPSRWLPVLVTHEQVQDTLQTLERLGVQLQLTSGVELLDAERAAERFEQAYSLPPPLLADKELAAAAQGIRIALRKTAMGDLEQAKEHALPYYTLEQTQRDLVKHRHGLAQDVFAHCMQRTTAAVQQDQLDKARALIEECIQDTPDLRPNEDYDHKAVELYMQQRALLLADGSATLEVVGDTSCVAIVNGRQRGPFPFKGSDLVAGIPYRVQASCAGKGSRVHIVRLEPGPNELVIDARFDAAIISSPYLGLRYRTAVAAGEHESADALALARFLRASDAVVVERASDGCLQLRRSSQEGLEVAVPEDPSEHDLRQAAIALYGAPQAGRTADRTDKGRSDARLWAGAALAAGAALNLTLSWRWQSLRPEFRRRIAEVSPIYARDYDDAGEVSLLLAISGNALLATAVPLVLPDDAPALAWIGGGLGLATAGAGVLLLASSSRCTPEQCAPDDIDPNLGRLVLLHSVPLLAVPLTYLVRSWFGSDATARVHFGGSGHVAAQITGRF